MFKKRQKQRPAQPADHYTSQQKALLGEQSAGMIAEVIEIRQQASTGQKCWLRFPNWGNTVCAAWLPRTWPAVGQFITVRGTYSAHEHHDEFFLNAKYVDYHR